MLPVASLDAREVALRDPGLRSEVFEAGWLRLRTQWDSDEWRA